MMLVHRRPVACGFGVGLAHIRAFLRMPVVVHSAEMIDARSRIDPNDRIGDDGEELTLTVEHRAAASSRRLVIELARNGPALALQAVEAGQARLPSLDERVTAALAEAQKPLPFADLRAGSVSV